MRLPIVTGRRLSTRNALQVSPDTSGAVVRPASQPSFEAMKSASGMKYMLATECSNPAATKAAIGGMIARILSVVVRAL
jgi:hypothetical protein